MTITDTCAAAARELLHRRAQEAWDDDRLQTEIQTTLIRAYNQGHSAGFDDGSDAADECAECGHARNHTPIHDLAVELILHINRIREIRQGIILRANLEAELDTLCFTAYSRAELLGVVP